MNTTDLGRLGEAKIIARLTELGWYVFSDLSGKCCVDLIAWKDGKTLTFQVKSTNTKSESGAFVISVGSIRPNRTTNIVKKYSKITDYLAVYINEIDTCCFIPSSEVPGRALNLRLEPVKGHQVRLIENYLSI